MDLAWHTTMSWPEKALDWKGRNRQEGQVAQGYIWGLEGYCFKVWSSQFTSRQDQSPGVSILEQYSRNATEK
jgi:hypothetical protein